MDWIDLPFSSDTMAMQTFCAFISPWASPSP
jgi:hypothetical protein